MPIVNSEKRALWPRLMLAGVRFDNIENYADSVFVVGAVESLISIRCVGSHNSITFIAALS